MIITISSVSQHPRLYVFAILIIKRVLISYSNMIKNIYQFLLFIITFFSHINNNVVCLIISSINLIRAQSVPKENINLINSPSKQMRDVLYSTKKRNVFTGDFALTNVANLPPQRSIGCKALNAAWHAPHPATSSRKCSPTIARCHVARRLLLLG